jgi:exosortase/archaeosortase family protein
VEIGHSEPPAQGGGPKNPLQAQNQSFGAGSKQKRVFLIIFAGFALLLLVLPLVVSFNELLTRLVEHNYLYTGIQKFIVPLEAKMMGALLIPFGYHYAFSPTNSTIVVNGTHMGITWNCLGWQSFLLLFITLLVGFRGQYSKASITEALAIGLLGTFWLNIFRMLFTILLAVHAPPVFRIVFHDYLAAITTVIWLFAFWWFAYSFVLEERQSIDKKVSRQGLGLAP